MLKNVVACSTLVLGATAIIISQLDRLVFSLLFNGKLESEHVGTFLIDHLINLNNGRNLTLPDTERYNGDWKNVFVIVDGLLEQFH